jgi:aspartate carbamoyltransferase catalytic subunit
MKHFIESQQCDRKTITTVFKTADRLARTRSTPLKGAVMASLFYEPSTRTRFSFESAMLRLGGSVMSTENASEFSSAAKGETLEDSIKVISHYADVIVLRHPEAGASARAASVSSVPVINAGDGIGQHPTQALLDLYTIYKEVGKIDGIKIALVGDLKHGRTVRSLAYFLGKYARVTIHFVAPPALQIAPDILAYLERHGVTYTCHTTWDEVLPDVDVLYQTRIQRERFKSDAQYRTFKGAYVVSPEIVARMKKGAIVMHPLPRVDEITPDVDALPAAAYFRQAGYGVAVRMALLVHMLTR